MRGFELEDLFSEEPEPANLCTWLYEERYGPTDGGFSVVDISPLDQHLLITCADYEDYMSSPVLPDGTADITDLQLYALVLDVRETPVDDGSRLWSASHAAWFLVSAFDPDEVRKSIR